MSEKKTNLWDILDVVQPEVVEMAFDFAHIQQAVAVGIHQMQRVVAVDILHTFPVAEVDKVDCTHWDLDSSYQSILQTKKFLHSKQKNNKTYK